MELMYEAVMAILKLYCMFRPHTLKSNRTFASKAFVPGASQTTQVNVR